MKPTLPEDSEPEETSADVSARYRAGAQDEPPARLDAAIKAAAHREVLQPRQPRRWQMPASIAAMLVIGVSLVAIVRDNEPPLPSLQSPAAEEAKLAKSAPPQLAMKVQPRPRADFQREERPSRERGTRPEREPAREWAPRSEVSSAQENAGAAGTLARSAPAPAAPPPAAPAAATLDQPAKAAEQERDRIAESSELAADKKDKALADSARESRPASQALRKQEGVAPVRPGEWLDEIDSLLGKGKEAEARRRLLEFREQYPHYPLPERLQALLAPQPAK